MIERTLPGRALALAIALLLAAASGGCDADEGEAVECPSDPGPFTLATSRVTGTVSLDEPPEEPISRGDSVVVRGTANHEDGLAIREVVVAGVSAERVEFNFKQWSATIAYEHVVLAAPANAQGQVVVEAVAIDACGNRYPFQTFALPVDQTPNLKVDALAIAVAYPGDRVTLPSNASAAATLTVTAVGRAAGARVTLAASSGRFQGVNASGQVVLVREDDEGAASATALFYADAPGIAVITATVEDQLATALVVAAAPPQLAPDRATLVPGASVEVLALTDGELARCQASPSESFEVWHGGAAIGAAAAAMERSEDGRYRLELRALAEAAEDDALTLTCVDEYGQAGSGEYALVVANPPPDVVVEGLTIDVSVPQGRDHLPASGSAAAVVTVTGEGEAANARVAVAASSGALAGAQADGTVVLAGGGGAAAATLLFTADAPGTVVLTASFGTSAFAVETVEVVAAPRLAPGGGTLLAGTSLDVVVLTRGEIASCQASPSAGITALAGSGAVIGAAPTAVGDGAGDQLVTIEVDADAEEGDTLTLTCSDVWGQFASGTFAAAAP